MTGVLFGLAPALSLSRHDLVEAFKEDGTRTTASRRSRGLRRALVVTEIALCLLMLVGAGLLVQTFMKLRAVDPGFNAANVLTARMSLQGERYGTSEEINRFYDLGLDRIRQIPGVQRRPQWSMPYPWNSGLNMNFDFVDTDVVETELMDWRYASPEYFEHDSACGSLPAAVCSREIVPEARESPWSAKQFARQFYKDEKPARTADQGLRARMARSRSSAS